MGYRTEINYKVRELRAIRNSDAGNTFSLKMVAEALSSVAHLPRWICYELVRHDVGSNSIETPVDVEDAKRILDDGHRAADFVEDWDDDMSDIEAVVYALKLGTMRPATTETGRARWDKLVLDTIFRSDANQDYIADWFDKAHNKAI